MNFFTIYLILNILFFLGSVFYLASAIKYIPLLYYIACGIFLPASIALGIFMFYIYRDQKRKEQRKMTCPFYDIYSVLCQSCNYPEKKTCCITEEEIKRKLRGDIDEDKSVHFDKRV